MPFQFRKEAIEEDLNSNFPSQGQGNPPLYYSLSEVVVPTYSINSVAEGSGLPEILQTAWDHSTGAVEITANTANIITNTGFWLCDLVWACRSSTSVVRRTTLNINDGISSKPIWGASIQATANEEQLITQQDKFVIFLRAGDSLDASVANSGQTTDLVYRQIATVNGTLINPLGFSFA